MINQDSIVTAYDEHLTLVEWLQKVEVLLKNGGLKEVTLNDNGSQYNKALFSLTLTFNDGSTIKSNTMSMHSVNEALNSLSADISTATQRIDDLEYEVDYHGFDLHQTFNKDNCVRIGTDFSTEEWTLKRSDDEIELSEEDANKAKTILLKAIKYGFIAYVDTSGNDYGGLVNARENLISVSAMFALSMDHLVGFVTIYLHQEETGVWKYRCYNS
mgnify:FL=1